MGYSSQLFTSAAIDSASLRSHHLISISSCQILNGPASLTKSRPPSLIIARSGSRRCVPSSGANGFYGLHAPLEPKSEAGLFLSSVFQNQRDEFNEAVVDELRILAEDRHDALARSVVCSSSDEFPLHRRILQLKEAECRQAVEDVMYLLVFSKFSDIHVPLVPRLSRCICHGRLEILPSKDWELESIHNEEVLEMINQHIFAVIGFKVDSSVTKGWATTEVMKLRLSKIYAESIVYGYYLKSASSRHYLEICLSIGDEIEQRMLADLPVSGFRGLLNLILRPTRMNFTVSGKKTNVDLDSYTLRSYVIGFDVESFQRCAKIRSKEAASVMDKQCNALFCGNDEVIVTSFASMKRLILEAVAFGSFLWDTEQYVNSLFRLQED